MIASSVWGSPTVGDLAQLPRVPIVSVTAADGALLRERLARGDTDVMIDAAVDTRWRTLPVLEATLDGPATGEELVLLSGHVDSWHLGAMDNASANAVMVAVAEALARRRGRLRRRLRVCFWSGHSHARYAGSTWYADTNWETLHDHVIAHVNVDSLGGAGASALAHAIASDELRGLGAHALRVGAALPFVGSPPVRAGDQSFLGIGVPSLFMTLSEQPPSDVGVRPTGVVPSTSGGLGWWWHTPEDKLARLDPSALERDARVYGVALWRLVTEPVVPFELSALLGAFSAALRRAEERWEVVSESALSARIAALRPGVQAVDSALVHARSVSLPDQEADRRAHALCRALNPVLRTRAGPFGHDRALPTPELPDLLDPPGASEAARDRVDWRHVDVTLRRGVNRTLAAIRAAEQAVG
ncbi:MAG: M28 family peptidase [Gemmatimonadaceae bacterium]|nr:M28 family peptidase [Gemmatimonadaceae bacterium]